MRTNKTAIKITVASPVLNGNEKKYVNDCLDTTWISSNGKYIGLFEQKFAEFVGAKHAIAVSNGTVGLHVALVGLGIAGSDQVIMPTLSYIATANSVRYCGGEPIFVDSEHETMNIDVSEIEKKISSKTKAIMPVHLYGHPVDMDPVLQIAKKHKLFVIEDAAEALGAYYKGKHVGPLGDVGVFSFFGNKNITTGEGGMIVTNSDVLAGKLRLLKGQGMDPARRYWHPVIGYNYRMTNIQAAIGLGQMEKIRFHLFKRQQIAKWYNKFLQPLVDYIELPIEKEYAHHGYWMYTIALKEKIRISRDELMLKMARQGIETRPVFYPMHTMPPYSKSEEYTIAENYASRGINLPTHGLLLVKDIKYVSDVLYDLLMT
jgi:perosamine synthetase